MYGSFQRLQVEELSTLDSHDVKFSVADLKEAERSLLCEELCQLKQCVTDFILEIIRDANCDNMV